MALLTNTQAVDLLKAVNFDVKTAIDAFWAINKDDYHVNREIISSAASKVEKINGMLNALQNEGDFDIYEETKSFNDGNNIYEEFVSIKIEAGKVVSVKLINNAYCREGVDLTLDNFKSCQKAIMSVCNSFDFEGYRGCASLMEGIFTYLGL